MSEDWCQLLHSTGTVSEQQWRLISLLQSNHGEDVEHWLVELGFVNERELSELKARAAGLSWFSLRGQCADPDAVSKVPVTLAQRYKLIPWRFDAKRSQLTLALGHPEQQSGVERVRARNPEIDVVAVAASTAEVSDAIERAYGLRRTVQDLIEDMAKGQLLNAKALADAILDEAVEQGASDIHLDPAHGYAQIRMRIDGVLTVPSYLTP